MNTSAAWAAVACDENLSLDDVAEHLRVTFRLYMLAEPDGDVGTFVYWVCDETASAR